MDSGGSLMKLASLLLLAFTLAACSKSNPTGPPEGLDTTNVSFSNRVQPILTDNCALPACHAGPITTPVAINEILSPGKAYQNVVNVISQEKPQYFRVLPFNSDSSYLYMKITGDPRIAPYAQMPYGKSPLPDSDIAIIKAWINQGAKSN
jgi:hypothetical protein